MVNGTTKNIYLLRHGKVEGKAALNGLSDVLVNPNLQQRICDALAQYDVAFDGVITSPLRRCSDLAKLYAQAHVGASVCCTRFPRNELW